MRRLSFNTTRTAAALLWLLIGSYQLWQVRHAPIGDFANYYYASQALAEDALPAAQLYEPYLFNRWVDERAPSPVFVNYAPVPPVSVLAYLPFAQLQDVYRAKLYFNIVGLVFFVGVFWWGSNRGQITSLTEDRGQITSLTEDRGQITALTEDRGQITALTEERSLTSGLSHLASEPPSTIDHGPTNHHPWTSPPLLLSPFLLWTPLYNNLYQGQSYLYMVAFLWLGFLCWRKKWWVGAALVWAVPISLKVFPAIILLFLLLKRYPYTFGWTIAFILFFSALPMLWVGYPMIVEYYQDILPRLFAGEINDPYTILYQSARVFFDQLFVLDGHLNTEPILHAPALASFLYLVFQWIILGLLVQLVLKRQMSDLLAFGLVILAGLLVSGYGSNYSMLLLFFPAMAIVAHAPTKVRFWGVGLLLLFIAGNIPIYRLQDVPFILQFPRMYALVLFLAWVYYWERPAFKLWVWVGLGLLLLVKMVLPGSSKAQLANYYLPDGSYPIIFDYETTEEGLLLYHYRGLGAEEDLYPTSDKIYADEPLKIINDQVFYGDQQLSQSRSRKKKPLRLNETEVVYLSDEGRGVGFYTLRKLKLP